MSDSACGLVVMRYGEVFLKGDNRRRFERLLEHNAEAALRGLGPLDLERGQGRLFLRTRPDQAHAALARLRYVFGFSSVSRAVEIEANPATLESEAVTAVGQLLGSWRPRTFRVRARRSDKRFPVISPEIGRRIGHALGEHYGLQVDLERAECTIGVEIGSAASFIYIDRLDGPGGLPVGTSAHVALLLSGGIDSPVAGYLALKRGCSLRAIYFHSPPHTSPYALDKVERLATRLARWQQSIALHVVDFSDIQQRIRKRAESPLLVLLYRRAMMRIAQRIAQDNRCAAIVTGESLGQVASQTVKNMHAIAKATDLPVLRPLLTFDKEETIALARRIGSYETSIEPHVDCCALFVPKHPATRVPPQRAAIAEARLKLGKAILRAAAEAEEKRFEAVWD
jgi:thiamine biosynthesis protein ThiI